jgi:ketosteroid isomerase-like protein
MDTHILVMGAVAMAASVQMSAAPDDAALLSSLSTQAYSALMKGDAGTFAKTLKHAEDFTLMQPFGGVSHGLNTSSEHLKLLGSFFRNGDYRQEVIQTIMSDDIAVLVLIEHQSVEVGGLPMQGWPLRVTLVFRREAGEWQLAHRHADPLVHGVTVAHAAALARGAFGEPK